MDAERIRAFLLSLPHVVETMQWGNNLVFWVGDKAIGGKMFALVDLNKGIHGKISYAAGAEHFAELVEIEGLYPAAYFARIYWIAAERWNVFRPREWEDELRAAHRLTVEKLPAKVLQVLELPPAQLKRLIAERTAVLAAKKKDASART